MTSTFSPSSRKGFSLIEVAIALVIFVIGALAIIRIFPGALNVITNNGDQQIATNLNRGSQVRLKAQNNLKFAATGDATLDGTASKVDFKAVPDATFNNSITDSTSAANGSLVFESWMPITPGLSPSVDHSTDFREAANVNEASSVIGIPRFNNSVPTTQEIETNNSISALSRYRAIVGEKAQPLVLGLSGAQEVYVTTQFPVSVQDQSGTILPIKPVLSADFTLNDVRISPNGSLDFSQVRVDDLDNAVPPAAIGVAPGSMLYVTYRYYNASGATFGIREEPLPLPSGLLNLRLAALKVQPPTGTRRDAARTMAGVITDAIVPELVTVRLRNYIGSGSFGAGSVPTALEQVADARRGLVRLPTGYVMNKDNPKPINVDYIADWSFLLQDGPPLLSPAITANLPAPPAKASYRQLALGAPFIEDQAPVGLYSLLIEYDPVDKVDVPYRSGFGAVAPDPDPADKLVLPDSNSPQADDRQFREDDLREGRATFIVSNSASRARVAYQTRDSWVQQLSVAANSYKPFPSTSIGGGASNSVEPWRDYILGDDNYLYFHAGEAGKTISISYTLTTSDGVKTVFERPFVIETGLINKPAFVSFPNAKQVARVELAALSGRPFSEDSAGDVLLSIQAVQGTSMTVRTAYLNGNKYAQTLLTSNRGTK